MANRVACITYFLALSLVVPLSAQMPEPPGVPPRFALVAKVNRDAAQIDLYMTLAKVVYETRTVEASDGNGKTIQKTVTVPKTVTEVAISTVKLDETRIVTAGKERLDAAAALTRLQEGTVVLLHRQGVRFDARYLSALNPETLILLEKQPEFDATQAGVAPLATPVPAAVPRIVPPAVPAPAPPLPVAPAAPK